MVENRVFDSMHSAVGDSSFNVVLVSKFHNHDADVAKVSTHVKVSATYFCDVYKCKMSKHNKVNYKTVFYWSL